MKDQYTNKHQKRDRQQALFPRIESRRLGPLLGFLILFGFALLVANQSNVMAQVKNSNKILDPTVKIKKLSKESKTQLDQIVQDSYRKHVLPFPSDTVLTDQNRRRSFLDHCMKKKKSLNSLDDLKETHFCWRLLTLRKAGKLPKSTQRKKTPNPTASQRISAEMAARGCEERFSVNLDRILSHPTGRTTFTRLCGVELQSTEATVLLKAALSLRKARRLRPELTRQLIQWKPAIKSQSVEQWESKILSIPDLPGIYIFRDKTGYLYIGEAANLRKRIQTHLNDSDRKSLSTYFGKNDLNRITLDLHIFPKKSPGKKVAVRRAYESELIRSRKPKFNIRP